MKLAVFTSQFPGRINTFFARDVAGLIEAGIEVEIFAIHPLDPTLWVHVPEVLSERVLPRRRVHHRPVTRSLWSALSWSPAWRELGAVAAISESALRFGPAAVLKTAYVVPKALSWAREYGSRFDHVLAYWGNYAATCAYLFHKSARREIGYSFFLHAGTDLYRKRVYLPQKLRYADNIIVVCDFNRQFLKVTYPNMFDELAPKIYLHHLGLDLDDMPFTRHGRAINRLVAVGGLHPSKGFTDLLSAAAKFASRREVEIVIVGDGPEARSLRNLAARLGISGSVRFRGWCSFQEVRDEMRGATLLVHPSRGLGDAVPTVIKEAMALGTPVVASAVAGIPELLDGGHCGVLAPSGDPDALAVAIESLLDDGERQATYAKRARNRAAELFSLSRNAAALANRLQSTSPQRRARPGLAAAAAW